MHRRLAVLLVSAAALLGLGWLVARARPHDEDDLEDSRPSTPEGPAETPGLERRRPTLDGAAPDATATNTPTSDGDVGYVVWSRTTTVRVVSAADDSPVEEAFVRVRVRFPGYGPEPKSHEGRTGPDGLLTLPDTNMSANWTVRKRGFVTALLDEREFRRDAVRLSPAPVLAGRVVLAGSKSTVEGARVVVWDAEGWTRGTIDEPQTTDAAGAFEIAGAPTDRYLRVAVAADGLGSVIVPLRPGEGRRPLEIEMGRGASVEGTVRDGDGAAVAGADVFVSELGGDDPLGEPRWDLRRRIHGDEVGLLRVAARADAGGHYRVRGLATPCAALVTARTKAGALGRSDPVELGRDGDVRAGVDVTVAPTGTIIIVVRSPSNDESAALGKARAWRDGAWGDLPDAHRAWGHSGRGLVFENVPAGPHRVFLDAEPFVAAASDVVVRPGERLEVPFHLDRGADLASRLVDASGQPVEGRAYWFSTTDGFDATRSAAAAPDGRFTIRGLLRTPGRLLVIAVGYADVELDGVTPGADAPRTIPMKRGARVEGRLRVESPSAALASVAWETADGRWSAHEVVSDDEGKFALLDVPADVDFDLFVASKGHAPFVRHGLRVTAGSTLDLGEIGFPDPHLLRGFVRDASGAPVVGATIRALFPTSPTDTSTDATGTFRLPLLPLGPVTVLVLIDGTRWAKAHVEMREREETVEITVPAPGTIAATVRGPRGEAEASLPLNLTPVTEGGVLDNRRRIIVRTDSVGHVEVPVAPGRYRLEPHSSTRRTWATPIADVVVESGARVSLDLVAP